jgi:hypothetical protein
MLSDELHTLNQVGLVSEKGISHPAARQKVYSQLRGANMLIRLSAAMVAAVSLFASLSEEAFGQQPPPSSSSEFPSLPPKVTQRIPPQDYQMMMGILQQMLQQESANTKPNPGFLPSSGEGSSNSPNPGSLAPAIIRTDPPTVPTRISPSHASFSVIHPNGNNSQAPPVKTDFPLLGTWQRKTDFVSCLVHIKPDHLNLEIDSRTPELGPIKVIVLAEYFLLKDQRTLICYITNIDIVPDRNTNTNGLQFWKDTMKIQQAFVETAIVVKVAIYQDAFVLSRVRIPWIDGEAGEIGVFLGSMITGRYERADSTKVWKTDR